MAMQLPKSTEVLIVGGGPTGLAAALSLHKQGCTDLVVVDAVDAEVHSSRAITMHAATLDAVDDIGCADDIIANSIKAMRGRTWDGSGFHTVADFSVLSGHTKHPFLCLVPQFVVEKVLAKHVEDKNITVIRPVKAVGLKVNDKNPELTDVTFEDGQVIQARYVIGADGAKSMVRQAAGISYEDPDGERTTENSELKQAVVADVIFENPPPVGDNADFMFVISNENIWLCLPLPSSAYDGQEVWRIAIGHPIGVPPHAPDTAFLQSVVDAYGPSVIPSSALPSDFVGPLRIARTIWSSRFRTESAISSSHFTRLKTADGEEGGAILLVGDAAHKHPPAGGQGMNLGLRDAVFLGPVLAAHIKQTVQRTSSPGPADKSLEEWAKSRHERALKVIRLTKALLMTIRWKDEITWYYGFLPVNMVKLRQWVMWVGDMTGYTKRMAAWQLSGLKNP